MAPDNAQKMTLFRCWMSECGEVPCPRLLLLKQINIKYLILTMLESLNYSFRNTKKHNLSNLPHQTVEKLQINHGVLRGPELGKQRWRVRLGILRVNITSYLDSRNKTQYVTDQNSHYSSKKRRSGDPAGLFSGKEIIRGLKTSGNGFICSL